MPIFPARAAPFLFGFLLSGFMSLMVSGIATYRNATSDFASHWMLSWLSSWVIAFPVVLVVAPLVRRIVGRLCASPT
jgi:hypothetical protein